MDIWKPLLDNIEFKKQISEKGYYQETKFTDWINKNNLQKLLQRSGAITANNLSIDFYSKQSKELVRNNLFLLRTGQGKFIIFNQAFFDKAYLDLKISKFEDVEIDIPKGYEHLVKSYIESLNENASLELLHFLKVFSKIIQNITGEEEYFIGPRGNRTSKFEVYLFNKKQNKTFKIYSYYGQEELDYSIFTKKAIFVFEAKNLEKNGFDIGWHKLAYPICRFESVNKPIYPCYFLKQKKVIWIFIFPEFKFYESGIILNDKKMYSPTKVFRINLEKLRY